MRHGEATEWLADYVTNRLPEALAVRVEGHVSHCGACQDWIETYSLVGVLETPHPSSDELALCVIRPEEISEFDRTSLRQHLERCRQCRNTIDLLRLAVDHARPEGSRPARSAPPFDRSHDQRHRRAWMRLAAAACFAVVAVTGVLVSRALIEVRGVRLAPAGIERVLRSVVVEHEVLEGEQLITGDQVLRVSQALVSPGARVRFRAGERVYFGDGFRIQDGGAVSVEVVDAAALTPR